MDFLAGTRIYFRGAGIDYYAPAAELEFFEPTRD